MMRNTGNTLSDPAVSAATEQFIRMANHPLRFRVYLFWKLPAALFAGLHVCQVSPSSASVGIRYRWLTRNPFKSTYFASLAMAAEMSTGLLSLMHVRASGKPVSMLVSSVEAQFHKKAIGRTVFTCADGLAIATAVQEAANSGSARTFRSKTRGLDESGVCVAEFVITWSFRLRETKAT